MDLITQGLNKIHRNIPREILDMRYNVRLEGFSNVNSNIQDIVIVGEVFNDMNLMSCNQITASLSSLVYKGVYGDKGIYEVPKILTNGLSIIDVIGVVGKGYIPIANKDTFTSHPTTVRAYLINRHTISVDNDTAFSNDGYVELTIVYDDRMKSIKPASYPEIVKAFILATKADIYNELVIKLGSGALYYGLNVDSIKNVVDGYSDARELYDEHMETVVGKVLFMNSDETMTEWVTGMLPNRT